MTSAASASETQARSRSSPGRVVPDSYPGVMGNGATAADAFSPAPPKTCPESSPVPATASPVPLTPPTPPIARTTAQVFDECYILSILSGIAPHSSTGQLFAATRDGADATAFQGAADHLRHLGRPAADLACTRTPRPVFGECGWVSAGGVFRRPGRGQGGPERGSSTRGKARRRPAARRRRASRPR